MQIRYVLADFELSYFFAKIKTRWNFWKLFLKTVYQKGILEQIKKKKLNFLLLSPDSWKLLKTSLKGFMGADSTLWRLF